MKRVGLDGRSRGARLKRDLSVDDGFVAPPDPWPIIGSGTMAVVIPTVSGTLNADEALSLATVRRHGRGMPVYLVIPEGLALEFPHEGIGIIRVPCEAMASLAAYNRMMITPWFYRLFAGYRSILVHQLDCLMLGGDPTPWQRAGWSYVGAPWMGRRGPDDLKAVGNGGFSLRRIDHMLAVLESDRFHPWPRYPQQRRHFSSIKHLGILLGGLRRAAGWDGQKPLAQRFAATFVRPEDEFWSQYAPFFLRDYALPPPRIALDFAFEARPRTALALTGGRLPVGCHAWWRMDREFWMEQLAVDDAVRPVEATVKSYEPAL
jgi:hypothetical protein